MVMGLGAGGVKPGALPHLGQGSRSKGKSEWRPIRQRKPSGADPGAGGLYPLWQALRLPGEVWRALLGIMSFKCIKQAARRY